MVKSVAIIFRVSEQFRKQMKIFAAVQGMSMKGMIVQAVEKFMAEKAK